MHIIIIIELTQQLANTPYNLPALLADPCSNFGYLN